MKSYEMILRNARVFGALLIATACLSTTASNEAVAQGIGRRVFSGGNRSGLSIGFSNGYGYSNYRGYDSRSGYEIGNYNSIGYRGYGNSGYGNSNYRYQQAYVTPSYGYQTYGSSTATLGNSQFYSCQNGHRNSRRNRRSGYLFNL